MQAPLRQLLWVSFQGLVHQFKAKDKRWHGDIKPDNILRVEGQWKLADFGFSEFELARSTFSGRVLSGPLSPKILIRGGTTTYGTYSLSGLNLSLCSPQPSGAPESAKKKSQTIDIWSFGCVLSVVATWIVKGLRGVQEFEAHRAIACRKRGAQTNSDAFHDGKDVYPDIKDWHDHLNEVLRKSDTVTSEILALVDAHMLRSNPDDRISSAQLCDKLDEILNKAECSLGAATKPGLHNHVKESLLMIELHLIPNIKKTEVTASIFNLPNPSQDGKYLQIYAQPSEAQSGSKNAIMGTKGRKTLSIAHREATLSKSVDMRFSSENPVAQTAEIHVIPPSRTRPTQEESTYHKSSHRVRPNEKNKLEGISSDQLDPTVSLERPDSKLNQDPLRTPALPGNTGKIPIRDGPELISNSFAPGAVTSTSLTRMGQNGSFGLSTAGYEHTRQNHEQNSPRTSSIGSRSFTSEQFWDAVVEAGTKSGLALVQRVLAEDPTIARTRGVFGRTPIMEAADSFNLPVVKVLVKHSDLEQRDSGRQNVLHLLILALARKQNKSDGDYTQVKHVLQNFQPKDPKEGKFINQLDGNRSSPLGLCIEITNRRMQPIIEELIKIGAWVTPPAGMIGENVLKRAMLKKDSTLALLNLLIASGGSLCNDQVMISDVLLDRKDLMKPEWIKDDDNTATKKFKWGLSSRKK